MNTENAPEIVVRLDRREADQVAKAVQQTGQPQTEQAAFLLRAAIREAKAILQQPSGQPDKTPPR